MRKASAELGRMNKRPVDYVIAVFCMLVGLVMVAPILFAVFSGFMTHAERSAYPPRFLPGSFLNLEHFIYVLRHTRIPRYLLNSAIVAVLGTALRLTVASLSAFSFAYLQFKGKRFFFFLILGLLLIPDDTLIIQNYITVKGMGLMDTYLGMCVLGIVGATNMFMLRQSFMSVARSIRESAFIDGCGNLRYFWFMCLPMSKPILTTLSLNALIGFWNQYLWTLMITTKDHMRTVQVGVSMLKYPDAPSYAQAMAAVSVAIIPAVFIFIFGQRNLVKGISAGAVVG